jgi:hemolysin D
LAYLEAQTRLVEQQHELIVQHNRATEMVAARRALESQREQAKAEYAHGILSDLADAE